MPDIDYFGTTNQEVPRWQQLMRGGPGSEACCSPGILALEQQAKQINASRLIIVGLCCELYTSFPASTGTEIMERAVEISASFANLQTELEDLLMTASTAETRPKTKNTSTPGSKL